MNKRNGYIDFKIIVVSPGVNACVYMRMHVCVCVLFHFHTMNEWHDFFEIVFICYLGVESWKLRYRGDDDIHRSLDC